jgi:hypothetical protein
MQKSKYLARYKALIRQFIKNQIQALKRKFPVRSITLEDVARHFIHVKKVLRECVRACVRSELRP